MSKRVKIILAVVAAVIVVVVAAYLIIKPGSAVSVTSATAGPRDFTSTVTGTGSVSGDVKYNVDAPTAGTLQSVNVKDGEKVGAGQTLAVMDAAPAEAQLASAKAQASQAKAQLDTAKHPVSQSDIDAAQAAYDASVKAYKGANANYAAVKKALSKLPAGTVDKKLQEQLASATAGVQTAQAQMTQAGAALTKTKQSSPQSTIDAAQEAYDAALDAVNVAQATVNKTVMKAPIAGTVFFNAIGTPAADGSSPTATKGSTVTPGAPPFTVVDTNALGFSANIDEADIASVEVGQKAQIKLDAFNNESFEATVTTVAQKATLTTTGGTVFPVTLAVNKGDKTLLLGMIGDATIDTKTTNANVAIPIDALFEQGGKKYVYKIVDDTLKKTTIETGTITQNDVEVTNGLSSGDKVALAGSTDFTNGMRVKVKNSGSGK